MKPIPDTVWVNKNQRLASPDTWNKTKHDWSLAHFFTGQWSYFTVYFY